MFVLNSSYKGSASDGAANSDFLLTPKWISLIHECFFMNIIVRKAQYMYIVLLAKQKIA